MGSDLRGRGISLRAASVVVSDLDKAIDFYTRVLGLEVRLEERRYNWVELGPKEELGRIALTEFRGQGPEPGGRTGLVLLVDDIHTLHRRAREEGAVFTSHPQRRPWGGIMATILDQDGNEISLLNMEMVSPWLMGA